MTTHFDLLLIRDANDAELNRGVLYAGGMKLGETLEDEDRYLEIGVGEKVYGQTAIPRGRYRVTLSLSKRFGRVMPEILDVPGFTGVRIHGGNTEADTHGCPLLGSVRTDSGVANCREVNERLIDLIEIAINAGDEVWLTVT